jgi:transcriptional regulator with XRE-family HTH domain
MARHDHSGAARGPGSPRERRAIVRHIRTESGRDWAAYLESALRSSGLTQAELARRSGLAESMVSRWLRGLNQPDVPNLRRVRPVLGVPMLELIVAAGYLSLEEAELQDAPVPPTPVQVGISTEDLTADQVRQLEGFATFLRAQNGPGQVESIVPVPAAPAEPLRYAAYGGARLSRDQQARVREQARLAREEAARSGRPVVFLDEQDEQRH